MDGEYSYYVYEGGILFIIFKINKKYYHSLGIHGHQYVKG